MTQGREGPTALVPAVTMRPGAVGEDTKGEGGALEPHTEMRLRAKVLDRDSPRAAHTLAPIIECQ